MKFGGAMIDAAGSESGCKNRYAAVMLIMLRRSAARSVGGLIET
jgi:hypothetical protein